MMGDLCFSGDFCGWYWGKNWHGLLEQFSWSVLHGLINGPFYIFRMFCIICDLHIFKNFWIIYIFVIFGWNLQGWIMVGEQLPLGWAFQNQKIESESFYWLRVVWIKSFFNPISLKCDWLEVKSKIWPPQVSVCPLATPLYLLRQGGDPQSRNLRD